MKNKNFKYFLKDSDQFIEIQLTYVIKTQEETHHEFIISETVLKEFGITALKYADYLKQILDKSDSSYEAAAELWGSNRCFTKKQFSISLPIDRDQIIEIVSANGTEYIEPNKTTYNFVNTNKKA